MSIGRSKPRPRRYCRPAEGLLRSKMWLVMPIVLALLVGSAWPAFGQAGGQGGQLAVRSDGFIFWIQDGQRHVVYPSGLSDEQINAFPEGAPLNASLLSGTPPNPAASAPATLGTSRATRLPLGQACVCTLIRG